jgi:choline kinase
VKAIILAAGCSSRLYPVTLEIPKCLLQIGKKKLIEHQVDWLRRCGIEDILVVTGYLNHLIEAELGSAVRYSYYSDYDNTNNLHTLYSVRDEMDGDTIILFSDVLLSINLLERCINSSQETCLIIDSSSITDKTMRVRIHDGFICDIGSHIAVEDADGNFIGVGKFSKDAVNLLVNQMRDLVDDNMYSNDYYTIALSKLSPKGYKIGFIESMGDPWVEIDTQDDYEKVVNSSFAHE